ncbi:MAG: 3-dehydroquinate synthase [Elusimicrobia bacterium]|nr:3-dehydroquinate synthase [Elusimicrobiota bacterium]
MPRSTPDPVFLLGFMASGKTSVGKALAKGLARTFLDTDSMVEAAASKPVRRIIEEDGEEAFRSLESRAVARACRQARHCGAVVALGGGAVLRSSNVRAVRAAGTVVFLDAPFSVLAARAADHGRTRPLWAKAEELFKARRTLYRRAAHATVAAGQGTPAQVADRVSLSLGPVQGRQAKETVVRVRTPGGSYPVVIGRGALGRLPGLLKDLVPGAPKACVVVADAALARGPGARLRACLAAAGWKVLFLPLPAGEGAKSFKTVLGLYDSFLKGGVERRTPVIALGGGSIGDAAGFAAATFMRGLPLVHVPTTLLSQADSSVGGKTGVSLPSAKNAVGAFHQPELVVSDTAFLAGLPDRDLLSGLAEVVKMALVFDRSFARRLSLRWPGLLARDPALLAWAVRRCVELKARVVAKDEQDLKGLRELLNFGHTAGHALEAAAGYDRLSHGEAVTWGMALAVRLSATRGWLKMPGDRALAEGLLSRLSAPPWPRSLDWTRLAAAMSRDKKKRGGKNVFVLLKDMGRPIRVAGLGIRELREALAGLAKDGRR